MDVLFITCLSISGFINIIATLYSYKRYKDLVELNRRTNFYPLDLKQSKNYKLLKVDPEEYHIRSASDNLTKFKFKILSNLYTHRKFQVTNDTDEEVAVLKKTKHWLFGRDYIHITSRNRYEVRTPTLVNSDIPTANKDVSPHPATELDIGQDISQNIACSNSGLSHEYSNIDSPTSLVSPYIDPALYSNYEISRKELGITEVLKLNQDFKRVERRKLFMIKSILNKKSSKSTSFQINKNSLEYKWINCSLMKVSKGFKQTPVMETLGIIDDGTKDKDKGIMINIQLNIAQIEEVVGLLSLYIYLCQIKGL